MKKKPLTLKKLREFIDDVRDRCEAIDAACDNRRNSGGCGFLALELYNSLNRYAKCSIRIAGMAEGEETDLGKFLESNQVSSCHDLNCNGFYVDHVVVEVVIGGKKVYVDTEQVFVTKKHLENRWDCLLKGSVDASLMADLCSEEDGWNEMFDRTLVPAYSAAIFTSCRTVGLHETKYA